MNAFCMGEYGYCLDFFNSFGECRVANYSINPPVYSKIGK